MLKRKAELYIICGFVGSGKTTLAKKLEKKYKAIRFSTDEWMIDLFGFNGDFGEEYRNNKKICKEFIWKLTKQILSSGTDVILDFGFWSRKERDIFRKRAKQVGVDFELYFLDVPLEELKKRVKKRNKKLTKGTFFISDKWLGEWIPNFEAPSPEENSIVVKSGRL